MKHTEAYLGYLMDAAKELAQPVIVAELEALRLKISGNRIYVVITGIFKRGKSSLINALLQEQIIPVGAVPVTAIITLIQYDRHPGIRVFYHDHTSQYDDINNLGQYVSEEENQENQKAVSHVIVSHPAVLLQQMTIVDTPGVGSALEHNTQTTLQFIPKIDAALFVLSADMPVSKADIEFLEQLQSSVQEILFVENKSDLLDEQDLEKQINYNKKMISAVFQQPKEGIDILPVSVKKYFSGDLANSGITELVNRLTEKIFSKKKNLLNSASMRRLDLYRKQLTATLDFRIANLLLPQQQLEEQILHLGETKNLIIDKQDTFHVLMQHHVKQLSNHATECIKYTFAAIEAEVKEIIETPRRPFYSLLKKHRQSELQKKLNTLIITKAEKLKNELESKTIESFKGLLHQYMQQSNSFLHDISENFAAFLGMGLQVMSEQFDLNVYSPVYLTLNGLEEPSYVTGGMLSFLLIKPVREKRVVDKIYRMYHEIIITNMSAIGYDTEYKIQESFRRFNYDFKNNLTHLLNTLEQEIQQTKQQKYWEAAMREEELACLQQKKAFFKSLNI